MSSSPPTSATISRRCPVCERDEAVEFLRKADLLLVRCKHCAMVYANPVAQDLASGRFYDRLAVPFYLSPDKLAADYAPVRFERELGWFRRFCPAGDVLDVGCSTGAFLFQLSSRYPGQYRVTGMDAAGAALDHAASRGVEVLRGSFLDHDFGGRRFDGVTFWAVMEHLVEPRKFLTRAAAVTKPRGHCIILVPNLNSLAVRLAGRRYRYIMPDHVNYFTRATLRNFVAGVPGWKVAAEGGSHFNPAVILKDLRGGDERVADEERVRLLKRTTALKQHPGMRSLKWVYGGFERLLRAVGLADNLVIVLQRTEK